MTDYRIADTRRIISPALLVFREIVERNIDRMIAMAGSTARLRPHCKTHKMREVVAMQLARGITKQKCATLAEAEMLAEAGVDDILFAYHPVGPNVQRTVEFVRRYPRVKFAVTADHPRPVEQLGEAMHRAGLNVEVLLDVDTGQHRTGLTVGNDAAALYETIARTNGLQPGGLHVYDGHRHQQTLPDRIAAVEPDWNRVLEFRDRLTQAGLPVPRIVAGGTPTFPVYAGFDEPSLECSPGTCIFHDSGYGEMFPDLDFTPAAVVLTRVVSRPTADRVTLDAGTKGVASDPPAGRRMTFPALPDAEQVLQNEEHLVLQTARAGEFEPGDELIAVPRHICPTCALHRQAYVIADGKLVDHWDVIARDRWLTV